MVMAFNYMHTHQSSDGAHEILIGLLPLLGCPIGPDKRKKRSYWVPCTDQVNRKT